MEENLGKKTGNSLDNILHTVTYNGTLTTVDWRKGHLAELTFGAGNITTLAFTAPLYPAWLILKLKQDSIGGRVVSNWPGTIKWVSGSAITLAGAAANREDLLMIFYNGTNYYIAFGVGYA